MPVLQQMAFDRRSQKAGSKSEGSQMALTFTNAPTVAIDDKPKSGDYNKLAAAFNDRLKSGLGDPTWRIWFKAWSMFRALIAPDESLTPAEDEWFKIWMHVPPEDGFSANAPTATHPWTRWAAGDGGLDPEDVRINAVPSSPDDSAAVAWANGKAQRGYVATTGAHAAPAFEASTAHYNIYSWALIDASGQVDHSKNITTAGVQNFTSYKFFKTFGGYLASPSTVDCFGTPTAVRHFVNLRDSSVNTYNTCPEGGPLETIELARIEYGASAYILYSGAQVVTDPEDPESGTHWEYTEFTRLPYHTWLEGPYDGTVWLQKQNGWQWNEVLCRYLEGFHGSNSQRASDGFRIRSIGFDYQKFFSTQYRLAPAYAEDLGGGSLDARYPKSEFTGPVSEGTPADFTEGFAALIDGGNSYHFDTIDGFGMAGYHIHAEGLTEPVELVLVDQNAVEADIPLTVNNGDAVIWMDAVKRPWIAVLVGSGQTIPDGATISIEFAHLQSYRPDLADAYVVLRRGTTAGGTGACDTQGKDYEDCVSFGHSYFLRGHILCSDDVPAVDETALNATPIYEAAREMLRSRLRFLDRDHLVSYTVDTGKSVVVFDRFLSFGGHDYDLFDGIAPPNAAIASGGILAGVDYLVRGSGGTVTYNGTAYDVDDTFTGVDGLATYIQADGDAAPWQVNGIVETAPKKGSSNRWLMFMTSCPYGGTGYEDDDYNDVYGFLMNRCMINSAHLNPLVDPDMVTHFCANSSGALCIKPEAPSGFNYAQAMNAGADDAFCEACPVYPADYEIEKVEMDYDTNRVTVTFKTQFRHSGDSSVRTDENAITDYLAIGGSGECPTKSGDVAYDAGDAPTHGACKPRFYFTKLVPEAYEDENDTMESTDTRLITDSMLWMNFILDAMCEGFIDTAASKSLCNRQPCYTLAQLAYEALGHRWFKLMPGGLFSEYYQGFGAMPNLKLYKEHFNDLAMCVNKLTTLPLELPRLLEYRTRHTYGYTPIDSTVMAFALGESSLKEVVSHGDLVFDTTVLSDWSAWTAVSTFSIGSTPCGFECGYQGVPVDEISSAEIGSGIASATTLGPNVNWWKPDASWPYVVAQQWRLQLRVSLASLNMLSADLQALIDDSGSLSVSINHDRTWAYTITGDGDATCGEAPAVGWGFDGKRLDYHSNQDPLCISVPFATTDDGEAVEVDAPLLGDPDSHEFSLARTFGYNGSLFGNCSWGAATNSYVSGIGYITIVVPLV